MNEKQKQENERDIERVRERERKREHSRQRDSFSSFVLFPAILGGAGEKMSLDREKALVKVSLYFIFSSRLFQLNTPSISVKTRQAVKKGNRWL